MKEIEIQVVQSSTVEPKGLAEKIVNNIKDTGTDQVENIFQHESAPKPGQAGAGILEAILTIIFASKAIDYIAKAVGDHLKKEKEFEINLTNTVTGKKVNFKSKNVPNVEHIVQELKKLLNNL